MVNFKETNAAAFLLRTRGYLRIPAALPTDVLEAARSEYFDLLDDCLKTNAPPNTHAVSARHEVEFSHGLGRYRIFPKLRGPFASPALLAPPAVVTAIRPLLGENYYCKFVGSDTCMGDARLQRPHRDVPYARRSRCYIVNLALVDCRLDNGPLEIWPCGSHLWRRQDFRLIGGSPFVPEGRDIQLEQALAEFHSEKVMLSAGDILIRDPGMLHRGTVNESGRPRPMLTIGVAERRYYYKYGDIRSSLDERSYQLLDENVRWLFDYAFNPFCALHWRMRWWAQRERLGA